MCVSGIELIFVILSSLYVLFFFLGVAISQYVCEWYSAYNFPKPVIVMFFDIYYLLVALTTHL